MHPLKAEVVLELSKYFTCIEEEQKVKECIVLSVFSRGKPLPRK